MKKILIIDDNDELRDNTSEIIQLSGYQTLMAANGRQGVELAVREKPDVIVCDIMMPELDGYGVLHLLRKNPETVNIPFIFLTAKTDRGDFRKGMEMGADDYITKPFDVVELLNAIETRLRKLEILEQAYAPGHDGVNHFIRDITDAGLVNLVKDNYNTELYHKKQVLYSEGKKARNLYFLQTGKIKAWRTSEEGKEYITNLYAEGDFIGYIPLIEEKLYEDTAEVLEDAEVMIIPRDDFMKLVYSDINIAVKFVKIIARNIKEKEERLLALAYNSLRKRVAKALVDIHEKFARGGTENPVLDITREDIANYVGTATESLIRTISDFKAEKLIEVKDGKIRVTRLGNLKNLLY